MKGKEIYAIRYQRKGLFTNCCVLVKLFEAPVLTQTIVEYNYCFYSWECRSVLRRRGLPSMYQLDLVTSVILIGIPSHAACQPHEAHIYMYILRLLVQLRALVVALAFFSFPQSSTCTRPCLN